MHELRETAFAKINLALHVKRRRGDGYHDLQTLFAFLDSGDGLSAQLAEQLSLEVSGPFAQGLSDGSDNLVSRVASLMRSHFGVSAGAALKLNKRLPVASGIGGGSADAAATARLLNRLWGLNAGDSELQELLAPLGADIPACVQSRTVRAEGTGTVLTAVAQDTISNIPALLVNPMIPVPTGAVFASWNGIDKGALEQGSPLAAALAGRNDLEVPAISICPEIATLLNALGRTDPVLARMSGSGATCFAIYMTTHARDVAQYAIRNEHPDWWSLAGALR